MPAGFDPPFQFRSEPWCSSGRVGSLALVAKSAGSGENIGVIARLKPSVTREQLQSQMDTSHRISESDIQRCGQALVMSFRPYQAMIGAGMRPFLVVLLVRSALCY